MVSSDLKKQLDNSINAKLTILDQEKEINKIIKLIFNSVNKRGGKILLCGNGGSAADAQHLAAEFLVRLRPHVNRKPIPALSLSTDISTLTACGNDYDYHEIFSRNLEAIGNKSDILIAITTSGNSKNILNVLKTANKMKIKTVGFLGKNGGLAKKFCDYKVIIKNDNTARIQESHIFLGHYIFEKVEDLIIR